MIPTLGSRLLIWSLLSQSLLAQDAQDVITSDTYFYGLSPPVFPTRKLFHPVVYDIQFWWSGNLTCFNSGAAGNWTMG